MSEVVSKLIELAERCEKATGPDRDLDAPLARAVGKIPVDAAYEGTAKIGDRAWHNGCGYEVLPFTASLDAAMTLVPEGWRWVMRQASPDKANPDERGFFARLETDDFESVTWGKGSDWITDIVAGQDVAVWAATPALALCAAALRARAAQSANTGEGSR